MLLCNESITTNAMKQRKTILLVCHYLPVLEGCAFDLPESIVTQSRPFRSFVTFAGVGVESTECVLPVSALESPPPLSSSKMYRFTLFLVFPSSTEVRFPVLGLTGGVTSVWERCRPKPVEGEVELDGDLGRLVGESLPPSRTGLGVVGDLSGDLRPPSGTIEPVDDGDFKDAGDGFRGVNITFAFVLAVRLCGGTSGGWLESAVVEVMALPGRLLIEVEEPTW